MGSSYTEYRGYGFWSRDWMIETWLGLLVMTIDEDTGDAPGKRNIRDDFIIQATARMNGCV